MKNLKHIRFWGAATAAHQVEGNTHNQWSVWEKANAEHLASKAESQYAHWLPAWSRVKKAATTPDNYLSGSGVDHYNRYEEDFDLASKKLHMNAFRFSVEWSRIEPKEGHWNTKEIEHYKQYVKAMRERGLEPMMSLWHWTMPTWFTDMGGFEKRRNVKYFVRFAQKIVHELGDDVTFVFTLNEPNVYSGMGYGNGIWPPNHKNPFLVWRVMNNLAHAHVDTYITLRSRRPDLAVGSAYHLTYYEGEDLIGKLMARGASYFANWWWLNKVQYAQDFIGFNFYFSDSFKGFKKLDQKGKKSDYGWLMQPSNIEHLIMDATKRYKKAVIVTENGLADAKDTDRKWWLEQTFGGMSRAIKRGAVIEGYLHWSLLDNFEWADGYWPEFGLIHVNRKTMKRTIRKSARWYGSQIKEYRKAGGHDNG